MKIIFKHWIVLRFHPFEARCIYETTCPEQDHMGSWGQGQCHKQVDVILKVFYPKNKYAKYGALYKQTVTGKVEVSR